MDTDTQDDKKKPGPKPEVLKIEEDKLEEALDRLVADRPKPKPKG